MEFIDGRLHGEPDARGTVNPLSADLAPRIVQARGVDGIAGAVKSIGVTAFANGADRILRTVRAAVSKDQRLLEAHRIGWPIACAGERPGLKLLEPPFVVEHRDG